MSDDNKPVRRTDDNLAIGGAFARPLAAPGRLPATARLGTVVILRKDDGSSQRIGGGAEQAVASAASSAAAPLPAAVRARFEGSLGADLSAVRVHTGGDSAAAARAVGARAYTVGNDIHFAAGQYAPADPFGLHLLAHEVAHTQQQAAGAPVRQHKLEVSTPGDRAEVEADRAADAMVAGAPAQVGASAAVLARDPDPNVASPAAADPSAAAVPDVNKPSPDQQRRIDMITALVQQDHDQAVADRTKTETKIAKIEDEIAERKQRIAAGTPKPTDQDEVDALETKRDKEEKEQDDLDERIDTANEDLEGLAHPESAAARDQILARRGLDSTTKSQSTSTENELDPEDGFSHTATTTTSSIDNGDVTSDTDQTKTGVSADGVSRETSHSHQLQDGDNTDTTTDTTNDDVDWGEGTYTHGQTTSQTWSNGDPTKTLSQSDTKSTTVGLDGVSRGNSTTKRNGLDEQTDSSSVGVSRGDGRIGLQGSGDTQKTTYDKDGKPVSSSDVGAGGGAGLVDDPEQGIGAYADTDAHASYQKNGVKVGATAALGGCVTCNVVAMDGSTPDDPKYQIVTTLSAKASAGASGGYTKGAVGGSLGVDVGGSVSITFMHMLPADQAKAYQDAIGAAEGGSPDATNPEFAIIATYVTNGPEAFEHAILAAKSATGSADAARQMKDGDEVDIGVAGSVEGKGGLSGNYEGASAEIDASAGKNASLKFSVARTDGKVVVTVAATSGGDWSAGGKAGGLGVTAGGSYGEGNEAGETVQFSLDPNSDSFDAAYADITSARTIDDARALLAKYPQFAGDHTESQEHSDTATGDLSAGPIDTTQSDKGDIKTSVTTKADGTQTHTYEGSDTHDGSIKVGDHTLYQGSHQEGSNITVDDHGHSQGDIYASDDDTDYDKSAHDAATRAANNPGSLVTGGAGGTETSKTVDGRKTDDSDLDALYQAAQSDAAWNARLSEPALVDAWEQCRAEVLASGGDHAKIAQALQEFMGARGAEGRKDLVTGVMDGGDDNQTDYQFPPSLASIQGDYQRLCIDDVIGPVQQLEAPGSMAAARDKCNQEISDLDGLGQTIANHSADFSDGNAMSEMLARITARKGQLGVELSKIERALQPPAPPPPAAASGSAPAPDAPQDQAQADAAPAPDAPDPAVQQQLDVNDYNGKLDQARAGKDREQALLQAIAKTFSGFFSDEPSMQEMADNSSRCAEIEQIYGWLKPTLATMRGYDAKYSMNAEGIIAQFDPDEADYEKAKAGQCPFK